MFSMLLVASLVLVDHRILVRPAAISSNDLQNETYVDNVNLDEESTTALVTTLAPDETDGDEDADSSVAVQDDVIDLNIGGQKMTTLRSTLTVIPNSKLARMFSKGNGKANLPVDKQGAVFFDYNPAYFNFLLDQLRAIKRMPKKPVYQIQFQAPYINSQMNFTHMLLDLGLTRIFQPKTCLSQSDALKGTPPLTNQFLAPMEGTHINLTVSSLAGWKECYRNTYNVPFDFSFLKKSCNGSRLMVACRPVNNKKVLTLAGIGQYEDISQPCLPTQCKSNGKSKKKGKKVTCSSNYQCITQAKRGVGWYNANNQTWGFVRGSLSFEVDPCDSSSLDADYRLCWTSQADIKKGTGDRCGSTKNLHGSTKWERLIYYIA